jgi:hypothetical protein
MDAYVPERARRDWLKWGHSAFFVAATKKAVCPHLIRLCR